VYIVLVTAIAYIRPDSQRKATEQLLCDKATTPGETKEVFSITVTVQWQNG
jgi:hypothetical protein